MRGPRAFPENLLALVGLESRLFQVLHDPLGEHLARIIGHMILEDAPQQIATTGAAKPIEKAERAILVSFTPNRTLTQP